ncbi:MAG: HD domain-containing protein [Spirochaetales bacterium]|nr:HD domain-containing protein [Spirochaetales bacterium]
MNKGNIKAKQQTKDLLQIIRRLHHIHDHSVLLERILHEARRFTNADAGTLYLKEKDRLYFNYIENDTLFPEGTSEDKFGYADQSIPLDRSSIAGYVASTGQPLMVDDVYALSPHLEYTFNPEFDQKSNYRTQSQLVLPLLDAHSQTLGVLQLINAKNNDETVSFTANDRMHISFLAEHAVLSLEKAALARETVMRMVRIAQLKDPHETGQHAQRVGEISLVLYDRFAESRGVSLAERTLKKEAFRAAAILHDIGKAGVSRSILAKDGYYDQNEKLIMYRHTVYGARLFPNPQNLWDKIAREVVLNHHERWDGSGYPGRIDDVETDPIEFGRGKRGKEIPLSARIVALADVYDALTTARPYKEAWTSKAALQYIRSKSGKLFDPELVNLFAKLEDTLEAIRRNYADSSL